MPLAAEIAASGTGLLQRAARAQAAGDLEGALSLWRCRIAQAPADPAAYLAAARALRIAQRFDEAESVAGDGLVAAQGEAVAVQAEMARIAEARGNFDLALQLWQYIAAAFPGRAAGFAGTVRMLIKLDRLEPAEAIIRTACARFPEDFGLIRLAAELATARRDWDNALRLWDQVLARFPDDGRAVRGRGTVIWHIETSAGGTSAGGDDVAVVGAEGRIVDVGRAADPVAFELVMQFESLGQNCEFGLVQRRFGAEPLGLLRWAFVPPVHLAHLLETRFAGFGEPDNVTVQRSSWGEYCVQDTACNLTFHTFQTHDIGDPAVFLAKQATRLRWLRDKLLADLSEANKIFVYKPMQWRGSSALSSNAGRHACCWFRKPRRVWSPGMLPTSTA
jgi:tetratricopeptide (TPR) repeat protein